MKIREDKKRGIVILCGKWRIGGQIMEKICEVCGYPIVYFDKYDSEFCPNCNEWLTSGCDDPECCYCAKRPTTPFEEFYR